MTARTHHRRLLAITLGLMVAQGFLRARAADADLVAAAEREGSVVWYTSFVQNQLAKPMAEAFEKAYPKVKVTIVGAPAGDLLSRMLLEGRSGGLRADVSHGGSSIEPLKAAGLLERYNPASSASYPSDYKDTAGYWTAENAYFLVAAVNTDMVRAGDEPHSYDDLLDPRWQGRMVWTGTLVQGGPLGFIGTIMTARGPVAGEAYLTKLATQKMVNLPANQRVVLDQVIAGEYPLALMVFDNHVAISMAQGAPVRWLRIEPVLGIVDPIYVLHGGPHPMAARLFVDFVISHAGQQVFSDADYLPADPATPPRDPTLRPAEGGFAAKILLPDIYEKGAPEWTRIYNRLFK